MYIDLVWYGGLEAPEYFVFTWSLNQQRESAWVREAKINLPAVPYCEKGTTVLEADCCHSDLEEQLYNKELIIESTG